MLAPKLPESLSIQRGFDKKSFGKKTPSRTEFLSEYAAILSCQDDISPNARRLRFLAPVGTAGGGGRGSSSYTIEYENIASRAKRAVLRAVVDERFGSSATRIMNILLDKGKLEEKHVSLGWSPRFPRAPQMLIPPLPFLHRRLPKSRCYPCPRRATSARAFSPLRC